MLEAVFVFPGARGTDNAQISCASLYSHVPRDVNSPELDSHRGVRAELRSSNTAVTAISFPANIQNRFRAGYRPCYSTGTQACHDTLAHQIFKSEGQKGCC